MRLILTVMVALAVPAPAQAAKGGSDRDHRWNITGPNWYDTQCGLQGFSVTHGAPYANWRKPCSVPIRVCEFERTTVSYPADPDVPCSSMVQPTSAGELKRTYIKRWD